MSRNFWRTTDVAAGFSRFVASIAVICGATVGCSDRPEDRAVKTVAELGGRIGRDNSKSDKAMVEANLGGTRASDDELKSLAPLTDLRKLDLGATKITDAGMKELAGFKSLEWLDLSSTNITDDGLKELTILTNLKTLILSHDKVTNAGIIQLAPLKNLQKLDLFGTPVTESGANELRRLLPGCKVNR
jgi:hypothetical protein